eukprot:9181218-Alexandrium_andersonii.AAC.1
MSEARGAWQAVGPVARPGGRGQSARVYLTVGGGRREADPGPDDAARARGVGAATTPRPRRRALD